MLVDARGHCEYVGVEYYVGGIESGLSGEQAVGAGAYFNLALESGGLALLVKGHDHDSRAERADCAGMVEKCLLAFFKRY